jgi:hypothetical protein
MVIVSPRPKSNAIDRPFLYPRPMLRGTIMNTRGRVHGKTIMDRPATYAITNHERYVECSFSSNDMPVSNASIIPRKINENNANEIITMDFFAITIEDM